MGAQAKLFASVPSCVQRSMAVLGRVAGALVTGVVTSVVVVQAADCDPSSGTCSVGWGACQDTPDWGNGISSCIASGVSADAGCTTKGYTCKYYATNWCESGAARPGREWTLGYRFNHPEDSCCVCGKKAPAPPPPPPCEDTPSWGNGINCRAEGFTSADHCEPAGYTCRKYEAAWCKDGAAVPGKEWTLAPKFNNAGQHCCVCGKGTNQPAPAVAAAPVAPVVPKAAAAPPAAQCQDTAGWTNGIAACREAGLTEEQGCLPTGYTCKYYEHTWCEGGAARPGKEWTLGTKFNFPDQHCCVCGKGKKAAPPVEMKCHDTPGWANGFNGCANYGITEQAGCIEAGYTCKYYEGQWCKDGKARPGLEWALGQSWNLPEENCCACGKKASPAQASAATSAGAAPAAASGFEEEFIVDNSALKSAAGGIEYRLSKNMVSRAGYEHHVLYGSLIKGIDEKDGWLKVGDRYLPMRIRGMRVLTKT